MKQHWSTPNGCRKGCPVCKTEETTPSRGKRVAHRDRVELIEIKQLIEYLQMACNYSTNQASHLIKQNYWSKQDLLCIEQIKKLAKLQKERE